MAIEPQMSQDMVHVDTTAIEVALGRQQLDLPARIFLDPFGLIELRVGLPPRHHQSLSFEVFDTVNGSRLKIVDVIVVLRNGEDRTIRDSSQQAELAYIFWLMDLEQIKEIWNQIRKFEIIYSHPSHDS